MKKLSLLALVTAITFSTFSCKEKAAEVKTETKKEIKEIKKEVEKVADKVTDYVKDITHGKYTYKVHATNEGSLNKLKIQPTGFGSNDPIEMEIEGAVSAVESHDLDGDGYPEILVYVNSAGSGSYGNVICYSPNNGKTLSQVYFPETASIKKISKGYMGHDKFSVVNNELTQTFPIYKEGDSNANPTGKTRTVTYKLVNGENSKKFVLKGVK